MPVGFQLGGESVPNPVPESGHFQTSATGSFLASAEGWRPSEGPSSGAAAAGTYSFWPIGEFLVSAAFFSSRLARRQPELRWRPSLCLSYPSSRVSLPYGMNLRPLKCTPHPAVASALAIRSDSVHYAETFQQHLRQVADENVSRIVWGIVNAGHVVDRNSHGDASLRRIYQADVASQGVQGAGLVRSDSVHYAETFQQHLRQVADENVSRIVWGIVNAGNILIDRKSKRLNSSHLVISYAVFCLKKK